MVNALRRYLTAGLLVWVPLGVTLLVVEFLIGVVDRVLRLLPLALQPDHVLGRHVPLLGPVLVVLVVLLTGVVAANFLGQQLVHLWELVVARIPVVRSVYSGVKQLLETVVANSGGSFRKVALVEYPRAGCYTLAFITGEGDQEIERKTGQRLVHVYVPTTPNPTSGFFLMLPRAEIVELDMSVDEGIKMLLSVGAVVPKGKDGPGHSG